MKCLRCRSMNTFRFLDSFGNRRVFCKKCWGSWPEKAVVEFGNGLNDTKILKLTFYQNNKAVRGTI